MAAPHVQTPAGGPANADQTRINNLDCATDDDKSFRGLQARFALAGHQLHRTRPTDGPVAYFACRWGLIRSLRDLDEARRFLAQIGGAA